MELVNSGPGMNEVTHAIETMGTDSILLHAALRQTFFLALIKSSKFWGYHSESSSPAYTTAYAAITSLKGRVSKQPDNRDFSPLSLWALLRLLSGHS